MKAWKLPAVVVDVALLSSCSSQPALSCIQSSPYTVVARFIECLESGDAANARPLFHPGYLAELQTKDGFQPFFDSLHSAAKEYKITSITRDSSSGDSAIYRVNSTNTRTNRNEYDTVSLKRDGDRWFITEVN